MRAFKNLAEVEQASLPANIKEVVHRQIKNLLDACKPRYDPIEDGWVILIDSTTTDQHAKELFGVPWSEVSLEGVTYDRAGGCFLTCYLTNNQFGYSIVVPDLTWLSPEFRTRLLLAIIKAPSILTMCGRWPEVVIFYDHSTT